MCARLIWRHENKNKHHCPYCDYSSYNKTIYCRHKGTIKHWLHAVFAQQAPRDIKIVVASFLPFHKIRYLGKMTIDALNYGIPDGSMWKVKAMDPGDPHAQNDVVKVHLTHNSRTQVFAALLV